MDEDKKQPFQLSSNQFLRVGFQESLHDRWARLEATWCILAPAGGPKN